MTEYIIKRGDYVLLYLDPKRKFVVRVEEKGKLETDKGIIRLGEVIGKRYGDSVKTHLGVDFRIIKPNLVDIVYNSFERRTQVMYPKDIGYVILITGIGPGSKVVEAGTGSGFLTAFLASYVRPNGHVYSYEVRKDFLELARSNLEKVGLLNYVTLKLKDITEGIDESDVDAVVLDMPTPWKVVLHAFNSLRSGGTFVAFMPTINQVEKTVAELRRNKFVEITALEILLRSYKVVIGETRPETLMIAHTGYIVHARKP